MVGVFEQDTPGCLFKQRHFLLRHVACHQRQRKLAHQLKTGQPRAQTLVRQAQQLRGGIQRRDGGPGSELRGGFGIKLHGGGRDDAQRAFRANEQIDQIVTRVVLAQARKAVPHVALRIDHFKSQTQVARVTKTHDLCAARVGAQVAADGATAFSRQAQRE